jgi:hypothetical protein
MNQLPLEYIGQVADASVYSVILTRFSYAQWILDVKNYYVEAVKHIILQ